MNQTEKDLRAPTADQIRIVERLADECEMFAKMPGASPDHASNATALRALLAVARGVPRQDESEFGPVDLTNVEPDRLYAAPAREDARDAARVTWLEHRLHSADFAYGDPPTTVITFAWPPQVSVGVDLRASIDRAMAAAPQGEATTPPRELCGCLGACGKKRGGTLDAHRVCRETDEGARMLVAYHAAPAAPTTPERECTCTFSNVANGIEAADCPVHAK